MEFNKINLSIELIKQTIKDTEWENKIYIAGGAVRDEILGENIKDIDLLVDFPNGGILFSIWITKKLGIYTKGNPVIYPRFGTSKFNLRKQFYKGVDLSEIEVECVMPRKEIYKEGDRKPDVISGTLKDDVDRRDFTINSLLKNLSNDDILDLTGMGRMDIEKGIVRTPLDPDIIFSDDPLRMMRAIRFTVKYNWILPMFMINSIKKNSKRIQYISMERIQDELNKMLMTKNPDKAIRLIVITKLSNYIFPEINKLINLKQNKYHKYDAFKHTLHVLKNTPPDLITRLAALFHDIGKYKTKTIENNEIHFYGHDDIGYHITIDIMRRLHYSRSLIEPVSLLVKEHMRTKFSGDDGKISNKTLRKLKQIFGPYLENALDLIHADNISHSNNHNMPNQINNIRKKLYQLRELDKNYSEKCPLNGVDVMKILNIEGGPIVGKILNYLNDIYLDNPSLSKEELEDIVKNIHII